MKNFLVLMMVFGVLVGQATALTDDAGSIGAVLSKVSKRAEVATIKDWFNQPSNIKTIYAKVVASDKFKECHPVVRFLAALEAITTKESISFYQVIMDDYSSKGDLLQTCFGYQWGTQAGNKTEQAVYALGAHMVKTMNMVAKLNLPGADDLVWQNVWHQWGKKQRESKLWQDLLTDFAVVQPVPAELSKGYAGVPLMENKHFSFSQSVGGGVSTSSGSSTLRTKAIPKYWVQFADEMSVQHVRFGRTNDGKDLYTWKNVGGENIMIADGAGLFAQLLPCSGGRLSQVNLSLNTAKFEWSGGFFSQKVMPETEQLLQNLGVPKSGPFQVYEISPSQ